MSKQVRKSIEEFKALLEGQTIVKIEAGPSADGGDYMSLKLKTSEGKESQILIKVGTVYGNLWFEKTGK